jgi:molybdopterin converting factor small subunit
MFSTRKWQMIYSLNEMQTATWKGGINMAVLVRIPTPLRPVVGGEKTVEVSGGNIFEVLENLAAIYPGIRDRLYDNDGLRRFINIFVNEENIRFLQGEQTPVQEGDCISIIPAIAGGLIR